MGEMHDMYGAWDNGEYNPFDDDVQRFAFACVNCDDTCSQGKAALYCSDSCQQEAQLVRYARRCLKDGRDRDPDVAEALVIRMGHVLGGGYPRRERKLAEGLAAEVIERFGGRCARCGGGGREIDHIQGNRNDHRNLQLLCRKCHRKKTIRAMRLVRPGDPEWEEIDRRGRAILDRIYSENPVRESDDPVMWPRRWQNMLRDRRRV